MQVSRNKRTILVIDDDQEVRNLFVRTLGLKGFEVISSASSEEAVDWAREIEPDLIFVSLLLPGSNGLKVSKAVHAQDVLKKVPIVMLITYKGELDPKYTSTIGVVDVLVKPLSAEAISSAALKILGEQAVPDDARRERSVIATGSGPVGHLSQNDPAEPDAWDMEFATAGKQENREGPNNMEEGHVFQSVSEQDEPGPAKSFEDDFSLKTDEPVNQNEENSRDILKTTGEPNIVMSSAEDPGRDEEDEFSDEPETGSGKKILTVLAVVLVAAVIALGAFSFRQYIPLDSIALLKNQVMGTGTRTGEKVKASAPQPKKEMPAASVEEAPKQEKASAALTPAAKPPVEAPVAAPGRPAEPDRKGPAQKSVTEAKAPTYAVQVGFFTDEKNAQLLVDKMKQKGYEAYLGEGREKIGKRVLVGRFSDRKEAQAQSRVLNKDGVKSIVCSY